MTRLLAIKHAFVEYVPEAPEEGVLYVSVRFRTATHRCACGCGVEVATPISPADWQLSFDGEAVSLYPSIGNWSLPCRSHYWIRNGRVVWARPWTKREIAEGRERDKRAADRRFGNVAPNDDNDEPSELVDTRLRQPTSIWRRIWKKLS